MADRSETSLWSDAASPLRILFDAVPVPMLVVDEDVVIHAINRAAEPLFGARPEMALHLRGGEALGCLRHSAAKGGCGTHAACRLCVVRGSVGRAFEGNTVHRQLTQMDLRTASGLVSTVHLCVTASPFELAGVRRILLMIEQVGDIVQLGSVVPLCSWCKQVRSGKEQWEPVDAFFTRRLAVDFSHTICDPCLKEHFPDLAAEKASEPK